MKNEKEQNTEVKQSTGVNVTMNFTVPEINQMLEALGKEPFKDVYLLVNRIMTESQAAIDAAQVPSGSKPEEEQPDKN